MSGRLGFNLADSRPLPKREALNSALRARLAIATHFDTGSLSGQQEGFAIRSLAKR